MLAPECKLDREAELAGINPSNQQRQVLRRQRPALAQLVRRLQPLHDHRSLSAPKQPALRAETGARHLRWPNRTASRSLGQCRKFRVPAAQAQLTGGTDQLSEQIKNKSSLSGVM